jgi:hypothetical protein
VVSFIPGHTQVQDRRVPSLDRVNLVLVFGFFNIRDSSWFFLLLIVWFRSIQVCVVVWTHNLNIPLAENGLKKWCRGEECVVLV